MSDPQTQSLFSWNRLVRLRQVLNLLAGLRDLESPPTSADGLRQSLGLLLELGDLVGLDAAWLVRVRDLLADQKTFNLVLAIVQYVAGLMDQSDAEVQAAAGPDALAITPESLLEWLPLVLQLLSLLRSIRGGQ